jgi:PAS domain S-box-containing protein
MAVVFLETLKHKVSGKVCIFIFLFFLFHIFFLSKTVSGHPEEQNQLPDTLRVGCEIDYPPYCYVNEKGQAAGFSVELFRAAAKEMGLEVQFKTGPWDKLKYDLVEHKLDALPLVGRTPEREHLFDFTFPYITMHGTIVVREGETGINSIDDFQGKEVAILKGDNAEEFLRRQNIDMEIIQRTTFKRALMELSEGQHDAVLIQRFLALQLIRENGFTNLKLVGDPTGIYKQSFCFAVAEEHDKLLSILNEGLAIVNKNGTYRKLHAKWFAPLKSYDESPQRIIVGGDDNYPPFGYLDKNGNPTGYTVELMKAIAEETGMNITFQLGPWAQIREGLKKGQIDAIQGILYSPERDQTFDMTPAHTHITYVIVGREGSKLPPNMKALEGKSVVVQEKDLMHDRMLNLGLDKEIKTVESQEVALKQLHNGKYDYAVTARILTNYYIEKHGWANLQMTKEPVHSADYCIGVAEGNTALLSKFTEGLAAVKGTGKYHEIYSEWLGVYEKPAYTFQDFLKHSLYVVVPLFIILIASFIWSRMLRKQVRKRTRELNKEIKERKKIEKNLRKNEKKYRDLFTSIRDAILVVDKERNIIDFNPAFADLFGYTLEEIKGKKTLIIFNHEEEYKKLGEAIKDYKEETRNFLFDIEYRRKDGTVFPGEVNVFYLEDEQNNITGFIGLIRDISERVKAREALRESKETAEQYLNIAASIILSLDLHGNITLLNDSGHQLLGYEKNELIGKNWFQTCLPSEYREQVYNVFKGLINKQDENLKIVEGPVITKTGERKTILWHNNILKNNRGETTGILTSGEDITERKRAEEQLKELNKKLQEQNEQIAAQNEEYETLNEELSLKNKELEVAREKAEESDRLKSAFLANMSHEIRTPMNGIMGFADLLKSPRLDDSKKDHYVNMIRNSGKRMLEIINNLLDIAKIESGQIEVENSITSVNDLLDELLAFFSPEAESKNLQLKKTNALPHSDALVVTDNTKLTQVLSNLIKNAIKYTKEGHVKFGYTKENGMLQFYVSDTGIGISPDLQDKMFERFRQEELSVTREYEGAGLGLSITKAYVEMLGGTIWMNSTPDEGSTFYFTIPYAKPNANEHESFEEVKEEEDKLPQNLTILVTEDDETSLLLIEEIIEDNSITVLPAANGKEAIEQVKSNVDIDLVLMDLKMPHLDGYEATRQVKQIRPDMPVIAQTAFASNSDRKKALEAGCDEYISKPISRSELIRAMKSLFRKG